MRVLATYALLVLAPLFVVETMTFGGGFHGRGTCSSIVHTIAQSATAPC